VELVEPPPAGADRGFVSELAGGRRTAEVDEGGVRPVAEVEQLGVDAPTLLASRRYRAGSE